MTTGMLRRAIVGAMLVTVAPVTALAADPEPALGALAERYFRGVYGCDAAVVDDLASDDIVATYPVFATIFGKPALRGREAVKAFALRFCQKWTGAHIQFHDAISDADRVVLLWSFSARDAASEPPGQEHSWGGITLLRFDQDGKVVAEIGEESEPGPMGRLESSIE